MAEPVSGTSLEENNLHAPICIVGGGPVGLSVSMGLTRAKIPHLLIESGGVEIGEAQDLAGGKNIGEAYDDPDAMRIRALGGTTHVWGGHSAPLHPTDFEKRDWIPHSGWPINFDDFKTWMRPAEKSLHIGRDWSADAFDTSYRNHVDPERGHFYLSTFKFAPIYGDGDPAHVGNFWEFNQDRIGARVITDTTIRHLEFDETGRVTSLRGQRSDGRKIIITADKFVLALGGIETARFLLINKERYGGPLRALDAIGRYFMEHPHVDTLGRLWLSVVK